MAFGNATKGYVKKHGGSGGGGTSDYEKLLNKPSINGVELLGDKKIGTLSGDIKMTLSDVSNMNLSNVANAQTLIFNALNQKWENKTPAPGVTLTDITDSITSGFDYRNYFAILIVGIYQDTKKWLFSSLWPTTLLEDTDIIECGDNVSSVYIDVTKTTNIMTLVKNSSSTASRDIYKVYGLS